MNTSHKISDLPDPYRTVRESMAGSLDDLSDAVTRLRQALMARLQEPYKSAAIAEFSPLLIAANFASAAASTLRDFSGGDDPWDMFNAMEHGATSIANCVLMLRVIEMIG
jgi:hypothetical protein